MGLGGYLRLLRWPGALTAAANAATGFLLIRDTQGQADDAAHTATLTVGAAIAAAGALVYLGGVVLNDVMDAERDKEIHPDRPLPSGDVTRAGAALLAALLFAAGLGVAFFGAGAHAALAMLGAALAATLYDIGGKRWRVLGSVLMGAARGGNAFAGCLASAATYGAFAGLAPPSAVLAYPIVIAGFTIILTFASTFEGARPSAKLAGTLAVVLVMPAALALPHFDASAWGLAAVPLLALAGTLVSGARDAQMPDGPGLGALIRRAVFGFLLIDATFLMGVEYYDGGFWLLLVYVALRMLLAKLRS